MSCHQEALIRARRCSGPVSRCVPKKCCITWQNMRLARNWNLPSSSATYTEWPQRFFRAEPTGNLEMASPNSWTWRKSLVLWPKLPSPMGKTVCLWFRGLLPIPVENRVVVTLTQIVDMGENWKKVTPNLTRSILKRTLNSNTLSKIESVLSNKRMRIHLPKGPGWTFQKMKANIAVMCLALPAVSWPRTPHRCACLSIWSHHQQQHTCLCWRNVGIRHLSLSCIRASQLPLQHFQG